MDNLLKSLETYYEKSEDKEKTIYDELAEKEEALFLAAKFGEKLLEEKEQLEFQLESLRKDYQHRIELLEQEKYELKMIIDTLKNEYENKFYELNEDIQVMSQQIHEHRSINALKLNENQQYLQIIQELNDKNQCLKDELKSKCENLSCLEEKYQKFEYELDELHYKLEENEHILTNYKNEISLKTKKTHELEYCLMQISSDFDKKNAQIDEYNKKLVEYENEIYELNQLIYQHEKSIELYKAKLSQNWNISNFDYNEEYENYSNLFEENVDRHSSNWRDECEHTQNEIHNRDDTREQIEN